MINKSDDDILEMFRDEATKDEAFGLLLKKYQERLYWQIRKIVISHDDTDDVLQNTCVKIWKGLGNFHSQSQLFTWLYRISTNEALSFLKEKQRKHFGSGNGELEELLLASLESDPYFDGDKAQLELQKAIVLLPEKQRLVFNMKYFDEMKYEEISSILQTSVGALKASYHHAVKKIESFLISREV
ncbi:RNA polymerase sigma factor [Ancylomarina euxinus]|uniref:RNA polymerase sigma factor n=1 Tax=Ancylomarina euxinus TaxID=2283627 RepID=A0A425XWG8_9BACT|nr:RNA polymerase sigma factor [Ancylomarina euxinus]MCZ4696433.1 RNA polymerase sigma factor [Ancylomarina euxinus]MUP16812.1 sigma-70 family RNA polymerase sigma factor [Ancylomarina euxinus]RRG18992.1 RNA polymerase sigma factor [Ancylomarina euxinus]